MDWLKEALWNLWEAISGTFQKWFEQLQTFFWDTVAYLLGIVEGILQWFADLVWAVGEFLYDLFFGEEGFVWMIFDYGLYWIEHGMAYMLEYIVDVFGWYGPEVEFSMQLIGRLNHFVPVVESGLLLTFYMAFLMVFIIVKWVLKLIPGLGG